MSLRDQSNSLPVSAVALRPGRYRLKFELTTEQNQTLMAMGSHCLEIETLLQGQQLLEGLEKARREILSALPHVDDD